MATDPAPGSDDDLVGVGRVFQGLNLFADVRYQVDVAARNGELWILQGAIPHEADYDLELDTQVRLPVFIMGTGNQRTLLVLNSDSTYTTA